MHPYFAMFEQNCYVLEKFEVPMDQDQLLLFQQFPDVRSLTGTFHPKQVAIFHVLVHFLEFLRDDLIVHYKQLQDYSAFLQLTFLTQLYRVPFQSLTSNQASNVLNQNFLLARRFNIHHKEGQRKYSLPPLWI
ncbi:hypothetical protein FGO68_gene10321 [Halteria grandinella]|uniref:Uncharacterized protein n=1 Tax=Halteria grandinella TaxID=5974 RepID=A0A8J8SWB5_HALGN|nr:hypothetical protein FGO68_gene10321 [Halteria grandinella]